MQRVKEKLVFRLVVIVLLIGAALVSVSHAGSKPISDAQAACVEMTEGTTCSSFNTGQGDSEDVCELSPVHGPKEIIYLETSRISCRTARRVLGELPVGMQMPIHVHGPGGAWRCRRFPTARFPL